MPVTPAIVGTRTVHETVSNALSNTGQRGMNTAFTGCRNIVRITKTATGSPRVVDP